MDSPLALSAGFGASFCLFFLAFLMFAMPIRAWGESRLRVIGFVAFIALLATPYYPAAPLLFITSLANLWYRWRVKRRQTQDAM